MAQVITPASSFHKLFVAGVFAVFVAYGVFVIFAPGPAELAQDRVQQAEAAIEKYRADNGELPRDLEKLVHDGYLVTAKDNFGYGMVYRQFDDRFEIYSVGPDGMPSTKDDVFGGRQ